MTGRELLLAALSGKPTPRVPVAPFVFNNVVNEFHGEEPDDPIAACIAFYKRFGFDILLRNYLISDYFDEELVSCENWSVKKTVLNVSAAGRDELTCITTPERRMSQTKSFRHISASETVDAIVDYYIKDEKDFAQFVKYQPKPGKYDCSKVTHARTLLGDDGVTGAWVQGAFNMLGTYRELSTLLMDPYLDPDFYAEMMEYFIDRVLGFISCAVEAGADFICISGNMASGSMAGPRMFEEYIMPYEKRVIDHIHKAGAKVIYHNCGDAKFLLPFYAQMEIDMYESLAAPPYGDTRLEDAMQEIPLPTVLSGGIDQISFLPTATPEEVRQRVKLVLETIKPRGGFILAASDYFSEGTPEANLRALAQAGLEFGGY